VQYAAQSGADLVILDTAGRLHIDAEMMEEVRAIAKATKPTDTVLVVDAMTGQDAVASSQAFHQTLELTGVILTKIDGDARGGAAVSLKAVTGKPILFVGVGEKIDDLDAFNPERMAGRILGMGDVVGLVEKAQEQISEKDAQANFEKMVMGNFTLEDMLAQLRMIRKLGPDEEGARHDAGHVGPRRHRERRRQADESPRGLVHVDDAARALATRSAGHGAPSPHRARRGSRGDGRQRSPEALQGDEVDDEAAEQAGHGLAVRRQGEARIVGRSFGRRRARRERPRRRGDSSAGSAADSRGSAAASPASAAGSAACSAAARSSRPAWGGPGGMGGDLGSMMSGPRPMGSSATRQSGSKKKDKKKNKKKHR
jgi:hypothetical protein